MNRTEFEILRDLEGKVIRTEIRFTRRLATHPALVAENIRIENAHGIDLILNITHNPLVGSTTFNVHIPGIGAICRLDVDGTAHGNAGRSHKHALQTDRCPARNLPDGVVPQPDLSRRPVFELFGEFCRMASIRHEARFVPP